MTKRSLLISVCAAVAIGSFAAVAAIAYPDYSTSSASPAPAASPIVVTIRDFAFKPSSLTVPIGTTVLWKNEDSAAHTATSLTGLWDSGNLDQGQSYTFKFTKAGSYDYVCNYHPNMRATITVKDSGQ
jgi:plastocyanin